MKLKSAYKFTNSLFVSPMKIFYLVIFLFEGIFVGASIFNNGSGSMSGMDFSSGIFIFVIGILMFKTPFHFLSGNSVSRKTLLSSTLLTGLTFSGIMFVIDTINAIFLKSLTIFSGKYVTLFEGVFNQKIEGISILKYILFNLITYFCFFTIGYFIGVINYRLPQKIKIALIIGIIAFCSVGLPFLGRFLGRANTPVLDKIAEFIKTNIFGSTNGFIITELILSVVLGLISYRVAIRANLNAK